MKLSLKIFIHAIYWMVFLMFTVMVSQAPKSGVWPSTSQIQPHIILNLLWAVTIFYLFYFWFIRFFEQGKFVKYLTFSILVSILITFIFLPLHKLLFTQFEIFNYRNFVAPLVGTFIIAQCGCLIRGFENWVADVTRKKELENRNLRNELELLRSQINPHFLFNSLNNIDSLIRINAQSASDALITLSDMLRYMTYESSTDLVPLEKEITYIQNYIKLQKLRFPSQEYIRLSLPQECRKIKMAPMLFIPFIENAFKHSEDIGQTPVIDMEMVCKENNLIFTCKNSIGIIHSSLKIGGFGLENVQKRLQLLYPQKHLLKIIKENSTFKVELQIWFS